MPTISRLGERTSTNDANESLANCGSKFHSSRETASSGSCSIQRRSRCCRNREEKIMPCIKITIPSLAPHHPTHHLVEAVQKAGASVEELSLKPADLWVYVYPGQIGGPPATLVEILAIEKPGRTSEVMQKLAEAVGKGNLRIHVALLQGHRRLHPRVAKHQGRFL